MLADKPSHTPSECHLVARPAQKIVAITEDTLTGVRLLQYRGVYPMVMEHNDKLARLDIRVVESETFPSKIARALFYTKVPGARMAEVAAVAELINQRHRVGCRRCGELDQG